MKIREFFEDRELTKLEMRCGAIGYIIGFFIACWLGYKVGTIYNNGFGFENIVLRGFVDFIFIGMIGQLTSNILGFIGAQICFFIFIKNKKQPEDLSGGKEEND